MKEVSRKFTELEEIYKVFSEEGAREEWKSIQTDTMEYAENVVRNDISLDTNSQDAIDEFNRIKCVTL